MTAHSVEAGHNLLGSLFSLMVEDNSSSTTHKITGFHTISQTKTQLFITDPSEDATCCVHEKVSQVGSSNHAKMHKLHELNKMT